MALDISPARGWRFAPGSRIEAVRAQIGGFASLEDLGATLDLPGDVVEGLRDQVVFLPRGRS